MAQQQSNDSDYRNWPWWWTLPAGFAGLLPLLLYWNHFRIFFYLGDGWDQLNEIDTLGYWNWVFGFFGENYIPVFKLYWSGLLFIGNGNHFSLIVANFILHVILVILFGYLLRVWGMGPIIVIFSQLMLALNYTGIEILSQSIQASNLICYIFLLLTLLVVSKGFLSNEQLSGRACGLIAVLAAMGALSFVRGMLIGPAILGSCLALRIFGNSNYKRLWKPSLWASIPCLLVGVIVAFKTYGMTTGSATFGNKLQAIGAHLFFHLSLNPLHQQIRSLDINLPTAFVLLLLNLSLIFGGIYWAKKPQRIFLLVLIFFFFGNAVLLALGRNHLPIDGVPSWRYQYIAILVFVPLVGILFEKTLSFLPAHFLKIGCFLFLLLWASQYVFKPWKVQLTYWSEDRGTRTRTLLDSGEIDPQGIEITGFHLITNQRARELRKKYNLH